MNIFGDPDSAWGDTAPAPLSSPGSASDPFFDALNQACLDAFGIEITYIPQGKPAQYVKAILGTTKEEDVRERGAYIELFVDLATLIDPPQNGDIFVIDNGNPYIVMHPIVDAARGVGLLCQRSTVPPA